MSVNIEEAAIVVISAKMRLIRATCGARSRNCDQSRAAPHVPRGAAPTDAAAAAELVTPHRR